MSKFKTNFLLVALLGVFAVSDLSAQIYGTGYTVMTFVDASRSNRQIETVIYYPGDISGYQVPLAAPSDKMFPVIVFGHDEATPYTNYQYLWDGLVYKGFMVAFPVTEMGPSMNVEEYAKDLAFVVQSFQAMRFNNTSFFFKRYNSKSCVMGHGYGGSAATVAIQYNNLITTHISLAAVETAPGIAAAASLITIPSVVFSGAEDCVAPAAVNQLPVFNAIDSDCKSYVNLLYASHCNFAQGNLNCLSNETLCNGFPVPAQSTNYLTNYLVVSFLRYYLKFNAPALAKFEWKLQHKTQQLSYQFNCNLNARIAAEEPEAIYSNQLSMYPNPVISGNMLNLSIPSDEALEASITITNMLGQIVQQQTIPMNEELNEITLPSISLRKGYYIVSVVSADGRKSSPLIVE
jgi:hypothetical protein